MALCVCTAWRAVIDGRRLLRTDLLPRSLGGIFIHFNSHSFSEYFFQTSSTTPAIPSIMDYVPYSKRDHWRYVKGHCNGLLYLYGDYVVNPATQWWVHIPPSSHPSSPRTFRYHNYLVFDPTLSSHLRGVLRPAVLPRRARWTNGGFGMATIVMHPTRLLVKDTCVGREVMTKMA
ncbi:hypothetical protein HU200_047207 [Digitaria exilis]|uniref:F-box domain-containing protein n=1 Tax=Digitaria exilis TaxID=1010633 RepID=A0A835AU02_9POAL|nr:hypothetical protein HU200_047207 [Digitaria exilis]